MRRRDWSNRRSEGACANGVALLVVPRSGTIVTRLLRGSGWRWAPRHGGPRQVGGWVDAGARMAAGGVRCGVR